MLGTALADFFVARCEANDFNERSFNSTFLNTPATSSLEFNPFDSTTQDLESTVVGAGVYTKGAQHTLTATSIPSGQSALLRKLWDKSVEEWQNRFGR
jgi:hypothetical protein